MNDFDEIVNEVLICCKKNLLVKSVEQEVILGLYYIKQYLHEGYKISSENSFLLNELILIVKKREYLNLFLRDIRFSILLFFIKTFQNISLENENKKDFIQILVYFDNLNNLQDNMELIKLLFPQDKLDEYLFLFNCVLESDANFFNRTLLEKEKIIYKLHTLTIHNYERNIESFKKLFEYLYGLFLKAIDFEDDELVFFLYTPMQFSWNAVSSTQEEFTYFNNMVEKKLELYIKNKMINKYNLKPVRKDLGYQKVIKVAFLQERFINYSIYKVFYSLLSTLKNSNNQRYEFIVLDLNFQLFGGSNEYIIENIKSLGFEYIDCQKESIGINTPFFEYTKKCLEIRKLIINKEIDILIGMHSQPEYNFLFTTRSAPKQVYWTHSNYVYDLENIDTRIKHGDFSINKVIHNNFTFLQFGDILDKLFLDPTIDKDIINLEKSEYPNNCIMLGTIGRLSKVNSTKYIKVIDEILEKNDNVIYICAGEGDIGDIKAKISYKTLNRWFFPGQVNPHLYGQIIDIWPNTFPNPQGLSTLEFMAKGKPVLTMKNDFHDFEVQNNYNKIRTDKFKDFKMNVENIEEYKRSLNLLINNMEARELIGKLNLKYIEENYYNTTKSLNRFYEILEEIIL